MMERVVVSCGFGRMSKEAEAEGRRIMTLITSQAPAHTVARKSINNFSVRQGMRAGLKVTLRGLRARAFLDKCLAFLLSTSSDFKGFDCRTNGQCFNFGLRNLHFFPEVDETSLRGLNVSVIFSNGTDVISMLRSMKFPFRMDTEAHLIENE